MLADSDDVESSDENVQDESDKETPPLSKKKVGRMTTKSTKKSAPVTLGQVAIDDWVWVKFTNRKYYAGQVQVVYGNYEFEIKFLRHRHESTYFWPDINDISDIEFRQIVKKLKKPKIGRRGEIIFEASDLLDVNVTVPYRRRL